MNELGARVSSPALAPSTKNAAEDSRAPIAPEERAAEDRRAPIAPGERAAGDSRAPNAPIAPIKGWHSRGYLPHRDAGPLHQMITYGLGDSLPMAVAERLAAEIDTAAGDTAYRARIEAYLDAGHGECWLRRADVAQIVLDSWCCFDGERYDLIAWVIMPNHVHVLVAMGETSLSAVVKGWKSFTARGINALVGRSGRLWQEDYWDRYIRNDRHFAAAVSYIHENPVKAGLAARAEDWPWSSVGAKASSLGARVSSPALVSIEQRAKENAGARVSSPALVSSEQRWKENAAEDSRAPKSVAADMREGEPLGTNHMSPVGDERGKKQ